MVGSLNKLMILENGPPPAPDISDGARMPDEEDDVDDDESKDVVDVILFELLPAEEATEEFLFRLLTAAWAYLINGLVHPHRKPTNI